MTTQTKALPRPKFGGMAAPAPALGMGQWCWRRFTIDHLCQLRFDQCYASGSSGHF